MIQMSRTRPGRQAAVARTKNGAQPTASAGAPPEADNVERPVASLFVTERQ